MHWLTPCKHPFHQKGFLSAKRYAAQLCNAILWPAIGLVGAIGTIYCIILGVRLAKADEAGSREKAKKDLIGAIIGFVVIFVLIVGLKVLMPILQDWVSTQVTT